MKLFYVFLFAGLLLGSCQVDLEGVAPEAVTAAEGAAADKADKDGTSEAEASEEETTSETISCETLFARGNDDQSTCFLSNGFNRWGWTLGPLEVGAYDFSLYSGAGQCDTEKGTLVGFMKLNYEGGMVTVDVSMLDGFSLSETHLYIGSEPYPTDVNGNETVAPGQFPFKHDLEDASADYFEVDGYSGPIYVIFHGVSCSIDNDGESGEDGADDGSSTEGGAEGGEGDGDGTGGGSDETDTGDYTPS